MIGSPIESSRKLASVSANIKSPGSPEAAWVILKGCSSIGQGATNFADLVKGKSSAQQASLLSREELFQRFDLNAYLRGDSNSI
jgi:hypothetical protein